ncbi:MAG: Trk family potassium uptake protein [Firmicutes bacterium]|nr:Trk family potassium uptake protein [Bacillota bacterium]
MKTESATKKQFKRPRHLSPAAIVMLAFIAVILVGAFFLALPISSADRTWMPFMDAFFMSASMVCITGYQIAPVGVAFSGFGQAVVIILIQLGALGFMTVATFILMLLHKKISLRDKLALTATLGEGSTGRILKVVRSIVILTLCIELAGALLLMPAFVYDFGARGIWVAVFVSISAFCNAGVDVFGDSEGFSRYIANPYVCIVIALLILSGGIGFVVLMDVFKNKFRFKKLSLYSKIVLPATGILLITGFLFFLGVEFNNPDTIGGQSNGTKVLAAFFESVSCRTAGFTTMGHAAMRPASRFFRDILMFIGAAPGSTGGGIKITTAAILFMTLVSGLRRKDEVVLFKRAVSAKTVKRAFSLFFVAIGLVAVLTLFLLLTQSKHIPENLYSFENILHESFGAVSTSGIGSGLIPHLSAAGKLAVAAAFFMGRIGLLPVGMMFTDADNDMIKYPEAAVPIG